MRQLAQRLMALEARKDAHTPRDYVLRMLTGETEAQALERVQPRYPVVMVPAIASSAEAWFAMAHGGRMAA